VDSRLWPFMLRLRCYSNERRISLLSGSQVFATQIHCGHTRLTDFVDMQPERTAAFRADFLALDQLKDKFRNYVIPMNQFQGLTPHRTRDLFVTHSLAYASIIQLHKHFTSRNANSNPKCLAAASAVVTIMNNANLSEVVYINPIIGVRARKLSLNIFDADTNLQTILMIVGRVFIAEITRFRTLRNSRPDFPVRDEAQLTASIESVMSTMARFAANCPIIGESLLSSTLTKHLFFHRLSTHQNTRGIRRYLIDIIHGRLFPSHCVVISICSVSFMLRFHQF
jgi:hypothetical protein